MFYNILLFYNTGFDSVNIPASQSILNNATYKNFDSVKLVQNGYLASIKIKATWEDVENADYCEIYDNNKKYFYFITSISMLNDGTAELSLNLDGWTTLGGVNNLSKFSAQAKRRTKMSGLFVNNLQDDFVPTQPLRILSEMERGQTTMTLKNLIGTTVELTSANATAKAYKDADAEGNDAVLYVPQLKAVNPTKLTINDVSYTLPGIKLYSIGDDITKDRTCSKGLAAIRSLGVESSIVYSYAIPSEYIETPIIEVDGGLMNLKGKIFNFIGSNYSEDAAHYPYVTGLYNKYVIAGKISGETLTFNASDIYNNDAAPSFRITVDPSPDGRPYIRPLYYLKQLTTLGQHSVGGSRWFQTGISVEGASGISQFDYNTQRQISRSKNNEQYDLQLLSRNISASKIQRDWLQRKGLGSSIMNLGVGIASTSGYIGNENLSGGLSGVSSITSPIIGILDQHYQEQINGLADANASTQMYKTDYNYSMEQRDLNEALTTYRSVSTPFIKTGAGNSISLFTPNNFIIYHVNISKEDMNKFDKIIDMYGEPCNEKIDSSAFNNGKYFTYIQAYDVNFGNVSNRRITSRAREQLANGVRVWKQLPDLTILNTEHNM